jgi:glycosyltransferase involved in cell wall biosynthesis
MPQLLILLASYQGSAFLDQQLLSIRRQTYQDWRLLVRNDGDDPDARALVSRHAEQDSRVEWLVEDNVQRLGPVGNFGRLLQLAKQRDCQYFALADQDDVWLETKLARQLMRLQEREAQLGLNVPLLIHSDLCVVDDALHPLYASFIERRQLDPLPALATLLVQNSVSGCSCVGNRALLELAIPLPECAAMHDWWLALCAVGGGELLYLDEPTVYYRQHEQNAVGASLGFAGFWHRVQRARGAFTASFEQAFALSQRLPASVAARITLNSYVELLHRSRYQRYRSYRKFGIRRAGVMAQGFYLGLLLLK